MHPLFLLCGGLPRRSDFDQTRMGLKDSRQKAVGSWLKKNIQFPSTNNQIIAKSPMKEILGFEHLDFGN